MSVSVAGCNHQFPLTDGATSGPKQGLSCSLEVTDFLDFGSLVC